MEKNEIVDQIISEVFAKKIEWVAPKLVSTVGPYFPETFNEFESERDVKLRDVKLALMDHEKCDLEQYLFYHKPYKPGYKRPNNPPRTIQRTIWAAGLPSIPLWFSAGFGNVEKRTDLKYWANLEDYKETEIVSLTLGFDPNSFDEKLFEEHSKNGERNSQIIEFLNKRQMQIKRKFNPHGYSRYSVVAKSLYDWIMQVDLEVDREFFEHLSKAINPKLIMDEIDPREKASLLQIIFVMAMDCYRFDPKSKRIGFVKEIEERAALNGIQISKETIRNHLKSAGELYNGEWKSE